MHTCSHRLVAVLYSSFHHRLHHFCDRAQLVALFSMFIALPVLPVLLPLCCPPGPEGAACSRPAVRDCGCDGRWHQ